MSFLLFLSPSLHRHVLSLLFGVLMCHSIVCNEPRLATFSPSQLSPCASGGLCPSQQPIAKALKWAGMQEFKASWLMCTKGLFNSAHFVTYVFCRCLCFLKTCHSLMCTSLAACGSPATPTPARSNVMKL